MYPPLLDTVLNVGLKNYVLKQRVVVYGTSIKVNSIEVVLSITLLLCHIKLPQFQNPC